jgi:hypothetical protein
LSGLQVIISSIGVDVRESSSTENSYELYKKNSKGGHCN